MRSRASLIELSVPWMVYDAERYLRLLIAGPSLPRLPAFEWGCGGSTTWLLGMGLHLTTIEHDTAWLRRLRARASLHPNERWVSRLIAPGPAGKTAGGVRSLRAVGDFSEYTAAIDDAVRPSAYSLILVDGRARNECMRRAIPHVAPGGALVLDNSDRLDYAPGIASVPSGWTRLDFAGHGPLSPVKWRTTVWVASQ